MPGTTGRCREQAALEGVGQSRSVGLGAQTGQELPDLTAGAGQDVEQLRRTGRCPRENSSHTPSSVSPRRTGNATAVRSPSARAACAGGSGRRTRGPRPRPAAGRQARPGRPSPRDEVRGRRPAERARPRPAASTVPAWASRPPHALGLPQRGGVPVEFGAERGQQLLEGHVGVRGVGQRGGHAQGRVQVAPDLELALQPDGRADVTEDADRRARRRVRPLGECSTRASVISAATRSRTRAGRDVRRRPGQAAVTGCRGGRLNPASWASRTVRWARARQRRPRRSTARARAATGPRGSRRRSDHPRRRRRRVRQRLSRRAGAATRTWARRSPRGGGAGSRIWPQDCIRNVRLRAHECRYVGLVDRRVATRRRRSARLRPVSTSGARPIDLNADLGEGFGRWRLGDDDALLTW